MSMIKKVLKLDKEEFYKKHLHIINHILPTQMTNKQAEVLAAFISLEGDLAKDPFSTTGRKIVMSKLGIQPGGLGNYLEQLKKKQFIQVNEMTGELSILPILIPNKDGKQVYQFYLEIDGN